MRRIKERKLEKDKGRRLVGLALLGPLGARLFERKLEKDKGRLRLTLHTAMKSWKKRSVRSVEKI